MIRNNLATGSRKDDNFMVNQVRGQLYTNPSTGVINIKAEGRDDWLGWVEPVREVLSSAAIHNTARVLNAVDADIFCLVEVEDRITLERFHQEVLVQEGFMVQPNRRYKYNMLIDGNDERGIDVGVFSRYPISTVCSHIKDTFKSGGKEYPIFSRDCLEVRVDVTAQNPVWVFANHFKSKGYGSQQSSNAKRKKQTTRVKEILQGYDLATQNIVVAGDFNDTPASAPLEPLLALENLHDVLQKLPPGERGTYKDGKQIDYLLVSTPLWEKITQVGVERRGIFRKSKLGKPQEMFVEITGLSSQASDHGAIWAEFEV